MIKQDSLCTISKRTLRLYLQVMVMVCTFNKEGNVYPVHYAPGKKYPQEGCKLWGTYGPLKVLMGPLAPIPLVSPRAPGTMPLYSIAP